MILYVAMAVVLSAGVVAALAPRSASGHPVRWVGFDGQSVLLIFALYVAAETFFGTGFAISLLTACALNEAGHVLAHRMLGRGASHFRLVPLLSEVPVQSDPFRDEGQAFFVALMGAGFSLAPMVLSFGLSAAFQPYAPEISAMLFLFGGTVALVNLLSLLPFRMLSGGRCAEIAARNFWPALAPGMAAFMIAASASAGLRYMSLPLLGLSLFGLVSLFWSPVSRLRPMGPAVGLLALAAYIMTLTAHFAGAYLLFGPE